MQTKYEIIKALSKNEGTAVSGQELAEKLGISRMAVSKAVKALGAEGYNITAQTNKGYTLKSGTDLFTQQTIKDLYNETVFFENCVTSTNQTAKELALSGAPHGTLCAAAAQTKGRGRRGKSFFSPAGSGVYFSVILRDCFENHGLITAAAAVAVHRVFLRQYGKSLAIKWVNDLFYENKKICGILTEAATSLETGEIEYAVVGIGLNLYMPCDGFPNEIRDIAGYIFGPNERCSRSVVCAEIAKELMLLCKNGGFIDEYREASCVIGKEILIVRNGDTQKAEALDINERGHLLVKYENGHKDALYFGEVKIII